MLTRYRIISSVFFKSLYCRKFHTTIFAKSEADYETELLLKTPQSKIRNIGIIAHIDAGKTTTTERMLYYSGLTGRIGNVDEGDTVTDYLTQEKDRGITIQSAAVTLPWNGNKINVIDTPGHADFTFEVIRSLRVLDGAVTILDAVAGVEAQTEKVWRQAKDLGIPIVAYVNKMDREGAGFGRTVKEIVGRLGTRAVLVNVPYFIEDPKTRQMMFEGVIDVFQKKLLLWNLGNGTEDGRKVQVIDISDASKHPELYKQVLECREAIIEQLGELDEEVIDCFFESEDYMKVPADVLKKSLKKLTIEGIVTPILCGASFKNIGVQPLMDAVVDFLPSPLEIQPPEVISTSARLIGGKGKKNKKKNQDAKDKKPNETSLIPTKIDPKLGCIVNNNQKLTSALAFKVINNQNRGLMIFVRIYSGKLQPNSTVINTRTDEKIKIGRLLIMNGDKPQEVKYLTAGNIGVITGTDEITTGDTLIGNSMSKSLGNISPKESTAKLLPIMVPPPVFSISIEPSTTADKRKLDSSLAILLKEDPSLKLDFDEESGQMILSGMGELHLEITKDRLVNDMKVNADVGEVRVTYKETILSPTEEFTKETSDSEPLGHFRVTISLDSFEGSIMEILESIEEEEVYQLEDNNLLIFEKNSTPSFVKNALDAETWPLNVTYDKMINSIFSGVTGSLQVGGQIARLPLNSMIIKIKKWEIPELSDVSNVSPLIQLTRNAINESLKLLPSTSCTILEPWMKVSVFVNDEDLGVVSQDLMSARNARILGIEEQENNGDNDGEGNVWAKDQAEKTYIPYDPTLQYIKSNDFVGKKVINAEAPLKEMIGYLNKIRSLTKGRGIFNMEYKCMERASKDRVQHILDS